MKKIIALTVLASSVALSQNNNNNYSQSYKNQNYRSQSYGTPAIGSQSYGTPAIGSQSYGTPAIGSQSYGTPAIGSQSYGTPAIGSQSYGTPAIGSQSYGTPAIGSQSYGTPAIGSQSYGTPAIGSQSYGTPAIGSQSYGTPAIGSQSYGTPAGNYNNGNSTSTSYNKDASSQSYNPANNAGSADIKALTAGITYSPLSWKKNFSKIDHIPNHLLNYHIGGMYIPAGSTFGGYGEYSQGTSKKTKDQVTIKIKQTNYSLGLATIFQNSSLKSTLGNDTNIFKFGLDVSFMEIKNESITEKINQSFGLNSSIISYWNQHGLELGLKLSTLAGSYKDNEKVKFSDHLKNGVTIGFKAGYSFKF